jgi:hypothetical protein
MHVGSSTGRADLPWMKLAAACVHQLETACAFLTRAAGEGDRRRRWRGRQLPQSRVFLPAAAQLPA